VSSWRERHIELIEACNAAPIYSPAESDAKAQLQGFREAVVLTTGIHMGQLVVHGDEHYIALGVDRPMCGGVFLDKELPR
jgi:hypothetical protein